MTEAWKAVVDGVQDARSRAHMKQISYTGMSGVTFVDCIALSWEQIDADVLLSSYNSSAIPDEQLHSNS